MIKYIGKYYTGHSIIPFIKGFEPIMYYDSYFRAYLKAIVVYYVNRKEQIFLKKSYSNENQLLEAMKDQFSQLDFEALKKDKKALEEYNKYAFFIDREQELNNVFREQSIIDGIPLKLLPDHFITINQLDNYNIDELKAILNGTYGKTEQPIRRTRSHKTYIPNE